jgi:NAD(P)-dependent dehydrogenase (short-subunit alcohol dehydrogenase family)
VSDDADRRVVVVTGGGGGIGAAIAEELGRRGDRVVTMDPLVTLDGAAQLPEPEETTAGRIVAAGGWARASSVSVTDADGVRGLFAELADELGRLDAVVNVAGITRPTGFATGTEEDWRSVLEVHVDGYRNVLEAALPIMAAAGRGRILGVTSGSGWRAADAGAYSCAKRVVASLTWQLGRVVPDGVAVNAVSPIAVTRMVTAALERMRPAGGGAKTGGLSLGSMPQPADLGPLGAHLVSDAVGWCRGQVVFAAGSEVSVVEPPGLLEVVDTAMPHVVDAWAAVEAAQLSGGGSNPRFTAAPADIAPAATASCAIVSDRDDLADALRAALGARGVECHDVPLGGAPATFAGAAEALATVGPVDAVVVALRGGPPATGDAGWARVLAEHHGIVGQVHADAAWVRAVAELDRPVRLVTLTDATDGGGRSRAQASAQLSRAARGATGDRVMAFAVSVESSGTGAAALAAHLVSSRDAGALTGAELAAGDGWFGLRSHPRPRGSVALGAATVPSWLDETLREMAT